MAKKTKSEEILEKVKFKFKFDKSYNPTYINGAFGGITPKGEIAMNFFLERHAIPNEQTYLVTDEGTLGEEVKEERKPDDHKISFVRYVETGVVFDYRTAKELQIWLNDKIAQIEEGIEK